MLRSMKQEGSATDFLTDVTDVSQKEEARRKKQEGISKKEV
ncbi:hypothetical protein QUB63_12850 [Microcoleus sp. ARI1-B5]